MPTPAFERPAYSRDNSPGPRYTGYNDSQDDFARPLTAGYSVAGPNEETYPLTAYAQHPHTPGTPYDDFEGDTGNSKYPPFEIISISQFMPGHY